MSMRKLGKLLNNASVFDNEPLMAIALRSMAIVSWTLNALGHQAKVIRIHKMRDPLVDCGAVPRRLSARGSGQERQPNPVP